MGNKDRKTKNIQQTIIKEEPLLMIRIADDCHGQTTTGSLKKDLYESDYFVPDDHQAKDKVIKDFLTKIGLTPDGGACVGNKCDDNDKKECLCGSLVMSTDKGSAALALGEVELFGKKFKRYVLWARQDSDVTITTGCDCKDKKAT